MPTRKNEHQPWPRLVGPFLIPEGWYAASESLNWLKFEVMMALARLLFIT